MNNISISLGKRQLVDSIWKSAGIEGLGTTFPNTERILENLPVETRRDEVLFIINMKHAWEFLFNNIERPNSLSFIRELNKICMEGLLYDAGNLRTLPVSIGGTSWVPERPQEGVVLNELDRINHMQDKLDSALEMFCYIARTQMFLDGNKRVAQLMCNKVMMENDIGILSVPYDKIGEFKEKLVKFYESGNYITMKSFLSDNCLLLNPQYKKATKKPETKREYKKHI